MSLACTRQNCHQCSLSGMLQFTGSESESHEDFRWTHTSAKHLQLA